jgi:hypothetical protein
MINNNNYLWCKVIIELTKKNAIIAEELAVMKDKHRVIEQRIKGKKITI